MLDPGNRRLLLDCLQPPDGFELDQAIGTTYSLDLHALLGVPVAFVFRDAVGEDGNVDPLATLEALRRYAARVHLFCQAGQIHVPRKTAPLLAWLEESVVSAVAPSEAGVFHPKCWLLRFHHKEDDSVAYRFICASRNLTFDRSWDTALVLDGRLESRRVRDPDPTPLQRFIEALPTLTKDGAPEAALTAVSQMAEELPRVRFECPEHVESLRFWPMGIPGTEPPAFTPGYRSLLVLSPFVSDGWFAEHVGESRRRAVLVSREDQLLAMRDDDRERFDSLYTLDPDATPEEDAEVGADEEDLLEGLHAKLFVLNDGWDARVWTGSANATSAAFHHNVELLVELVGKKSRLGIGALLGEEGAESGIANLLSPWALPEEPPEPADEVSETLDELLRDARGRLAGADLKARIGADDEEGLYPFAIDGAWPELPAGVSGEVRPIGLDRDRARPITGESVAFGGLSLEAISAFVAVELSATQAGTTRATRFVLRLPTEGMPSDRSSQIMRRMLRDGHEFMRLLLILLADDGIEAMVDAGTGAGAWSGGDWLVGGGEAPLLESLLKTLDRAPERLDQVHGLLEDLRRSGRLEEMLPDGFLDVWQAVWANREAMRANG